jgi:hypothetical protein
MFQVVEYLHLEKVLSRRCLNRSIRVIKIVLAPFEYVRRRFGIPQRTVSDGLTVPEGLDYLALPRGSLEDVGELTTHCQGLLDKRLIEIGGNYEFPYTMILDLSSDKNGPFISDPEALAPIIKFATQPRLIELITNYIGEIPVISNVTVAYTAVNDMTISAQQFHIDGNQDRQLHLVVDLSDVGEDAGPFTFVPGDKSRFVRHLIGHDRGRVSDETLFQHIDHADLIHCTGKAGAAYLVNAYACLHQGARSRGTARYILIINYTSLFEWSEGVYALYRSSNRQALDDGSKRYRDLLNL